MKTAPGEASGSPMASSVFPGYPALSIARSPTCRLPVVVASLAISATLFFPSQGISQEEIPINVQGPRVIVPTSVNGSPPLNLVLDTGMGLSGVYLLDRKFSNLVDMRAAAQVRIPGAGAGEASTASVADNQLISMGPVVLDSQTVFVSQSEGTQGWSFDGVVGRSLLVYHTLEIDYDESVIRLHNLSWHPEDPGWKRIPMRVQGGLPWLEAEVEVEEGITHPIQVYIDLAAASTLELLVGGNGPFSPPEWAKEEHLGTGLSGEIRGWRGTSHRLRVGGYDIWRVPTQWAPATVRSKQGQAAGGILGNGFVRHFNVVFQYAEGALYIKPNQRYRKLASQGTPPEAAERAVEEAGENEGDRTPKSGEASDKEEEAGPVWQDLAAGPVPTRYTVGPDIRNWAEITQILISEHPAGLREAGIGGTVQAWVLVDREGTVRQVALRQSSGHEELDELALRVAAKIRFSPALNGTKPVPAWFAVPLRFPS
jgi:TonB family protein